MCFDLLRDLARGFVDIERSGLVCRSSPRESQALTWVGGWVGLGLGNRECTDARGFGFGFWHRECTYTYVSVFGFRQVGGFGFECTYTYVGGFGFRHRECTDAGGFGFL